jgi:hypothetical protein
MLNARAAVSLERVLDGMSMVTVLVNGMESSRLESRTLR